MVGQFFGTVVGLALAGWAILALGGCAETPRQQAYYEAKERAWHFRAATDDARAAMARCARTPFHNKIDEASCANDGVLAVWRAADYPYMDLLQVIADARLAGARRVDRDEVTTTAYEAQIATLSQRVSREASLRELEARTPHWSASPPPARSFAAARAIRRQALLNNLPALQETGRVSAAR